MVKLSRKMEYSLIALKHLDAAQSLTSAKELSQKYQIPFDVVSRVLQVLTQQNVVRSAQGTHGGYKLIKPLNTITFFELAEMIDGTSSLAKCLSGACELKETCNIKSPIEVLNHKVANFLKTILVSDLLVEEQLNTLKTSFELQTELNSHV